MTTIKSTSKQGQSYIMSYNRATASSLAEVYGTYSTAKSRADYYCRQVMEEENGTDYRVISYNSCFFSVGWKTENGLRIETKSNSVLVTF